MSQKEKDYTAEEKLAALMKSVRNTAATLQKSARKWEKERDKHCALLHKMANESLAAVKRSEKAFESFEESLLYVIHNIKKNQFLYSHYPEDWVKNFLSLKEGIQYENKFMENQGAINE